MATDEGSSFWERVRSSVQLRGRLRAGVERLRTGWWQILQTAVAAGAAWLLAVLLLGNERPVFASIAAVLSLGLAVSQRGRRAVELLLAVTLGAVFANLLVLVIGVGPAQISLMVALALAVAAFFLREQLGVNEVAISAMILLIVDLPSGEGLAPDRLYEALVGCGVALAVNALLPFNPRRMVENAARPLFDEAVAVLKDVAAALDGGDPDHAEGSLVKARELDERVRDFKEALEAGHETAQLSPPRRRTLGHLDLYASEADQIDLIVRNVRGLARACLGVVRPGEPAPEGLSGSVQDLARAVEALAAYLQEPIRSEGPEDVRRFALSAAGNATALLETLEEKDLAVSVLVGQIRSAAVDLLGAIGASREEALRAIDRTSAQRSAPEPD